MTDKSNNQGRAYEYICLCTLKHEISKTREVAVLEDSHFQAALTAWNSITPELQSTLSQSAKAAVLTLFDFEPLILEDGEDTLTLLIQSDKKGEGGDVRDILIIRRDIHWEIGLSVKHNHFAVKHSRLSDKINFGKKWFGVPCSEKYWEDIAPVFSYLNEEIKKDAAWSELPNKVEDVYIPLLEAFVEEVKRSYALDPEIPKKLVEYLLGLFDFYKVISVDKRNLTQIQTYNLRGTLNRPGKEKPKIVVPVASLPTRIVHIGIMPDRKNTVEVYMDGGWQFTFRIHNASTKVEASLKFDIQLVGMPATILLIDCKWNK